jgi:hypothetical protein
LYLQIEHNRIVIKIRSTQPINDVKWAIYEYLKEHPKLNDFTKQNFRNGNVMSIGSITYNYSNYVERIKTAEAVLDEIKDGVFFLK